jgi:hypothetical protein
MALACGGAASPRRAEAKPPSRSPAPPKVLPLSIAVASRDGVAVVDDAWLREQVARAVQLLGEHGVHVGLARRRALAAEHAALETAADRDALAAHVEAKVINVFVVATLRDVDDPTRLRMGVRWRLRKNLRKDYVIVAASAMPTTLAHELGHYFGNGHSFVRNNVMSYLRDEGAVVRFDAEQGRRMREVARGLLARGVLVPMTSP